MTYTAGALTVAKKALTITASAQQTTYGTALALGTSAYTYDGLINGNSISGVTLKQATNTTVPATQAAATYSGSTDGILASAAEGSGLSNYSITYQPGTLTINQKALTITANGDSKTYGEVKTYGSGSTAFTTTALANSETIGSVTVTDTNSGGLATAAAEGSYALTPSLATGGTFNISNYAVTYTSGNLVIIARPITLTATNRTKVYGDTLSLGTVGFTHTGGTFANSEVATAVTLTSANGYASSTTHSVSTNTNEVVPSAATGTGNFLASNYSITYVAGSLEITTRPITLTATNRTKFYGDALTLGNTAFTRTAGTFANGELATAVTLTSANGYDLSTTRFVGTNANEVVPSAATGTGGFLASNYNITYTSGSLAITARPITLTATNRTKVYGDALVLGNTAFTRTAGSYANSESATAVVLTSVNGYDASTTQAVNAAYANEIVPSLATGTGGFSASNYNITYLPGDLEITQKALSITANNQATTYGTSLNLGNTSFSSVGLINGDSVSSVTLKQNGNQITPALQDAGTYEGSTNGMIASLATGSGLSNYAITYLPGRLTINQLNTATWTGAGGDTNWSTAANWANNAVPLRANVNNVVIPAGFTVNFDSTTADNANKPSSEINNRSNLVFNLNTDFDFSNTLSGSGSIRQQGSGILTISGRNSDYTGNTYIGSSRLHLTNAAALGSGALVSNGGQLSMANNITLPSLNVARDANNSGQISLASSIYTFGAQNYAGNLVIAGNGNTRLETLNSNIYFSGTITAGSNSKGNLRSLLINAGTGTVTFNERVGSDRGLYANFNTRDTNLYTLSVRAARIEINADIMTFENQIYRGAIIIGDNGTNGLIRTLISVDPSIVFDGTIDDATLNTHTLHALAIAVDTSIVPTLSFKGDIGGTQALASIEAVVGIQLTTGGSQVGDIGANPATFKGTISIEGNVTTAGDQSFTANNIILGAAGIDQLQKFLTTDNGNVNFNVGLDPNAISINDDASSYGLLFDLGRGSLNADAEVALASAGIDYDQIIPPSNIMDLLTDIKNQLSSNATDVANDDLVAEVAVENIEDAGDAIKCDSDIDENCAVTL